MPEELKPINLRPELETYKSPYQQSNDMVATYDMSLADRINMIDKQASQGKEIFKTTPAAIVNEKRYSTYYPGQDNEELYAQSQTGLEKAYNGVAKMVGTATSTFINGTAGLVYGIGKSIEDRQFSSFYDNQLTNSLNDWTQGLEDKYAHYKTQREINGNWWEPSNLLTGNFLWDNVVKNLGFSLGAAASGFAWGAGLKALGITGKIMSAGAEMAAKADTAIAESLLIPEIDRIGATTSKLETIWNEAKVGIGKGLMKADRGIVATFGTVGESGMEALNNSKEFRQNMIDDFVKTRGYSPEKEDLDAINEYAQNVGNTSFVLNSALLSATNYIQLPKIYSSSFKAEKEILNNIAFKEGKFISTLPEKGFAKTLYKAKNVASLFFNTSEAFEEGAQYAIQTGTQNYFDRKYKNQDVSILDDGILKGVKEALTSSEGMLNIFTGGFSGALQSSGVIGIKNYKPVIGQTGKIGERGVTGYGGEEAKLRNEAISSWNNSLLKNKMKDAYGDLRASETIQRDREAAIRQGDILESKDLEFDYAHTYINSRLKYNAKEAVTQEINSLKQEALTPQGFASLQQQGYTAATDTRESFIERLNNFEEHVEATAKLTEAANLKYKGLVNKTTGDRIYSDEVIDKLVYAASKVTDYDKRIPKLSQELISNGVVVNPALQGILGDEVSLKGVGEALEQIKTLNVVSDKQEELKQSLFDILEMSSRRKLFIEEYNNIKNNPAEFTTTQTTTAETTETTPDGTIIPKTIKIKTKDGEEELEIGSEYYLGRVVEQSKEGKDVYRFPKLTILKENEDGTIRIKSSEGNEKDITKAQLADYKLGKVFDTDSNKKAKFFMDNANTGFEFNFGKGNKVKGRLEYSSKKGILKFVYRAKNGSLKYIEVTGDQFIAKKGFNSAMITPIGTLTTNQEQSLKQFTSTKDDRQEQKKESRLRILSDLHKEVTEQLTKSKNSLEEKQNSLESIQEELTTLSNKIVEGDLTKKSNFKASTNRAIKSANKLSRLQEEIRLEIEALESEQEQLEINKAYIEDTMQNIDELPTDSKDFIEELENQVLDLQILHESTGKQINLLSKLQDNLEDALDTTISFLKDLVKKFTNKYPNVPTTLGQDWVDFIKANPKFLKLKPNYKEDLKELEATIANTEDFIISPDEDRLEEVKKDITSLLSTIKDIEKELAAKELIANKFVAISEEYRKQEEERIKLLQSEEIKGEIEAQQKLLDNNTNLGSSDGTVTAFEPEARKSLQVFINSTSSPTDSYTQYFRDIIKSDLTNDQKESSIDAEIASQEIDFQKLPAQVQRERIFLNSLSPKDSQNYQTLVVSPKNAHVLGLESMFETFYPTGEELNKGENIDESPIYTVYVKTFNGKLQYVNQDGTSTGFSVDTRNDFNALKDVIVFSTLAKVVTSNIGDKLSSKDEQEYEKTGRDAHRKLREYYLKEPKPILTSFMVSQGFRIPSVTPKALSTFIEKEYDNNSSILVGEGKELIGANKESFLAQLGHVYYRGSQTIPLSNRKFNKDEQAHIQKVLTTFINQLITPASTKDSDLQTNCRVFLEGVLYFQRPKEGKTPTQFQIYTDAKAGTLNFGDTSIPFYSINSTQAQSQIASFLANAYNNINLKKLTKNETFVSDPFDVENSNKQNYYEYIRDNNLLVAQISKKSINGNTAFGKYAILNTKPTQDTTASTKTQPQTTPVSNIEAKKADIEKRRQEELDNIDYKQGKTATERTKIRSEKAKKINAKYDAELIALKQLPINATKPEVKPSPKPNGLLDALRKINNDAKAKIVDTTISQETTTVNPAIKSISRFFAETADTTTEGSSFEDEPISVPLPSVKKSFTVNKNTFGDFSIADNYDVERMSEEEKKEFKAFIKKNLPQFTPLEVEELINATNGRKAWGKLEDNVLVFYKAARKGTGYHEAFEGVWKYMTSQEEKSNILSELREKDGQFYDRVSETDVTFNQATDGELKEYLADSFAEYINTPKTISSRIKSFFDRIVKFFRSFLVGYKKNNSLVDELFSKIESGKFKKVKINTSSDVEYSFAPKGWTVRSTKMLVDNIVILYFNEILKQNKSFFDTKTYEDPAVWKSVKEFLTNNSEDFTDPNITEEILDRTKLKLKTLGIQFENKAGEEDRIKILDENKGSEYNDDKMTLSVKKSSPFPIKFMLSSLFEVGDTLNNQGLPQAKQDEETNMLISFPFSKAFIQILEATYKADSYDDTIAKLKDLIDKYPVYERVLAWMTNSKDLNIANIDINSLQMLNAFYKSFNKQNPGAFAIQQYGNEVVMISLQHANATDAKEEWRNRLFYSVRGNQNPFIIKQNKSYISSKELETYPIKSSTVISFLNTLGVDISEDTYSSLTDKQQFKIIDLAQKIKNVLTGLNVKRLEKDSLKINGPLESIARIIVPHIQETTFNNGDGERQQRFIQHNIPSVFTHILNNVKTKQELLERLPYLNSPFATNSIIWNTYFNEDGTRNDIKSNIGYIENVFGKYRATDSTDLDYNQRLSSYLNGQLYGFTEISVAADASIPWNMTLPQIVKFSEFRTKTLSYADKIYNYFLDEIALSKTKNKAVKLANDKLSKELRFFNDITTIDASKEKVLNDFEKYVETQALDLKQQLLNENELAQDSEELYVLPSILTEWFRNNHFQKNREDEYVLTEEQLMQFLKTSIINSFSSQVEFHKLFIGDPYLYKFNKEKGKFDETKRVKSLLSPANPSLVSDIYNKVWYNDINQGLVSNTLGYIKPKNALTFSIIKDLNVKSLVNNELDANEADAQAIHSLGMGIDFRSRQGILFEDQKDWYKWDTATARTELDAKYPELFKYSDEQKALDKEIIKKGEPSLKNKFTPIKPIVRGNEYESTESKTILHKISSYDLSWALAKNKGLEDLYIKMFKENIDYVVMESGAKVGTDVLNDLYQGSSINPAKFKTQKVGWDSYYNQVENLYSDADQTLGSQNTKLNTQDFFENGELKDPTSKEAIQDMNDALLELTQTRFDKLLSDIGVNPETFTQEDSDKLRSKLLNAATTRDVPYNIIEALKDKNYPIEALPNYIELQNVLMSLVRDSIVSMEVNGAPHVQVSAMGFEDLKEGRSYLYHDKTSKTYTKATKEQISEGKNLVMASSKLKIPTKESPYMEVMIPMWFRGLIKNSPKYKDLSDDQILELINKDSKILEAIGFRIPTQAMSSISPIKIAGFLPEAYGKTVVVPSEITAISGSDFDIDKLNMYLKNLYIDVNGDLKEIPSFNSFEEAKTFIITHNLTDLLINSAKEDADAIDNLTDEDFKKDEDYNDRFYQKSLENKYFNNMIKVLTSPYNLEALVTPLDSPILKDLSKEMQTKLGVNKEISLLDITTPQGIAKVRTLFMMAKKWVGIGALGITGHAQFQQYGGYIDTFSFGKFSLIETPEDKIPMGNILNQDNQKISTVLSWLISSYVDVAKDEYITHLIYDKRIVGTVTAMVRMGLPLSTIFDFVNQPIIRDYVQFARLNGYTNLSNQFLQKNFLKENAQYRTRKIADSFSKNSLSKNIGKTDVDVNEQRAILNEFQNFFEISQALREFTTSTNWDTVRIKNTALLTKRQQNWEKVKNNSIVVIDDKFFTESRAAKIQSLYKNFVEDVLPSISNLQSLEFQDVVNQTLSPYFDEYMDEKELEKLADNIQKSVFNYLIQTKVPVTNTLRSLDEHSTSLISKFNDAKFNGLQIKTLLEIKDNMVFLKPYPTEVFEKNVVAGALEELREFEEVDGKVPEDSLYKRLLRYGLAQGVGNYNSLLSYVNMDDLRAITEGLHKIETSSFITEKLFAKNNWKRFPSISLRVISENKQAHLATWGRRGYKLTPIMSNGLYNPDIKNRALIIPLSKKDSKNEFFKINRIAPAGKNEGYYDVADNAFVSKELYNQLKTELDPILKEVIIYEKVEETNDVAVYRQSNVYGNGIVSEYPLLSNQPSAFDNGTTPFSIDEILDRQTIYKNLENYFHFEDNDVPLQKIEYIEYSKLIETPSDKHLTKEEFDILPLPEQQTAIFQLKC